MYVCSYISLTVAAR